MRIRTLTLGINATFPLNPSYLLKYASFLYSAKQKFKDAGWEVQTIRLITQPWENFISTNNNLETAITVLDQLCKENAIDYCNLGTTRIKGNIPKIFNIITNSEHLFSSAMLTWKNKIHYTACTETAKLIKKLAAVEPKGFDNLRFASLFNVKPHCPFFPAAYHAGKPGLCIGTENSDIVYSAFSKAKDIQEAETILQALLYKKYQQIQTIATSFCKKHKINYYGIDTSISTSVHPNESIAFAFEKLGIGKFGEPGTLAIAQLVTKTIQNIAIQSCGYRGLMLPVLEDYGLAQRNTEGYYDVYKLLTYSAVCGTGLDTLPLPGDISKEKLTSLLIDIASLSNKLQKPLSARLMPIPNKKYGEKTNFDFPYFVNTKIMKL